MKDYTTIEFLKICEENIPQMEVIDVAISVDVYTVRFKKRQTLADYISNKQPTCLTFKDADGDTYEIRHKYANIDGHVKSVYILQDLDGDIVDVFGLYELQHPERFGNSRLNLTISRIIKEVN